MEGNRLTIWQLCHLLSSLLPGGPWVAVRAAGPSRYCYERPRQAGTGWSPQETHAQALPQMRIVQACGLVFFVMKPFLFGCATMHVSQLFQAWSHQARHTGSQGDAASLAGAARMLKTWVPGRFSEAVRLCHCHQVPFSRCLLRDTLPRNPQRWGRGHGWMGIAQAL